MSPFPHPETGVLMSTQEEFQAALTDIEERLAPLYRVRRSLRDGYTERFEPVLPPPRFRSQIQERVARCPRCGNKIPESEEAATE